MSLYFGSIVPDNKGDEYVWKPDLLSICVRSVRPGRCQPLVDFTQSLSPAPDQRRPGVLGFGHFITHDQVSPRINADWARTLILDAGWSWPELQAIAR